MNIQGMRERFEAKLDEAVNSFVAELEEYQLDANQRELIRHMLNLLDRGIEATGSYSELFQVDGTPEWEERMNEAAHWLSESFPE